MRRSRVFVDSDEAEGHLALLNLLRGVSAWNAWAFDPMDVGLTITVGSTANCDWQIASPGVSPMFLAFTGESLVARALAHDPRVRLNGAALEENWVALRHGDRLDFGVATLGVSLGPALHRGSTRAWVDKARRGNRRQQGAEGRERAAARAAALARTDEASRQLPVLFREPPPRDAPTRPPRVRYAAIALGLLLAYAGWLMLLDEL